ncbi:MAG TPA: response regulator transcription factor [Bacillaceae bacterium]|nr:response regulator transcription factor [Paenibacillus bovis]HLU21646.1 response regulator transcription factor [Bacillaceae bacterium]
MEKILIVEDEGNIRGFILINLKRHGYQVVEASSGEEALAILQNTPDISLVLLDIMLPGIDGFQVCKEIRQKNENIGIIMLTAKTTETDKVDGLLSGADDYISKPFSPNELVARIKTLMRRIIHHHPVEKKETGIRLDRQNRCVYKNGTKIELSPTEYAILSILDLANGDAINRNDILDEVWGLDFPGDSKIVDVNIRRIRQKLEDDASNPTYIQTVWGFGYKWVKQ